ncbi:MAG: hypothetical protein WA924_08090 [Burkholderiaceae bacterium]
MNSVIPEHIQEKLAARLLTRDTLRNFYAKPVDSGKAQYVLRYYEIYCLVFVSFLLALFMLRAVCLVLQEDRAAATLAPLVIAAIFPLVQTNYGTFYDMPELLFMATAAWLALRGRLVWLTILVPLATLNKESFPFFALALYPFLRLHFSRKLSGGVLVWLFFLGGLVNLYMKSRYAGNAGGPVEFHLFDHLRYLANPRSYFLFEFNYGVLTTKGLNIINLFLLAVLVKRAWPHLTATVRQHIQIAFAINLPLFLVFGVFDELRNLSMLYVGLTVIFGVNIAAYLAATRPSSLAGPAQEGMVPTAIAGPEPGPGPNAGKDTRSGCPL